jgi:membrane protease YdiL (CAAX protease family)
LAVVGWMALGWALGVDANEYLLLGIPITAGFQLLVRRRPLHVLWVRDATDLRIDRRAAALAIALAVTPVVVLVRYLRAAGESADWPRMVWLVAAAVGSVGAAFAFRKFTRATVRPLLACMASAGAIGVVFDVAARLARPPASPLSADALWTGAQWFLLYLPVALVLEEVFFRGALDAHVHRPGEAQSLASAGFVSALWGLWHLPVTMNQGTFAIGLAGLLVVHVLIGVPLSLYWRRTGNLAVPGTVHALVAAVRNALLAQ